MLEKAVQICMSLGSDGLRGELTLTRTPQGLYAQGKLTGRVMGECSRCLEPVPVTLTGRLGEGWLMETRRWALFSWAFARHHGGRDQPAAGDGHHAAPGAAFKQPPSQSLRIPMQLVPGNRVIFLRHQNILPPFGTR